MTSSNETILKRGTESAEIKKQYKRLIGRKVTFILISLAFLVLICGISALLGSAHITIWEVYSTFLHKFFPNHFESSWLADVCVWDLRLPRILMGTVAGAGLGIAGCVMQSVLRNPLASPYTLGISSGAGFGASLAILTCAGRVGGKYLVIGNAFVFALLSAFIIIGLSSRKGATPEAIILSGIALTFLFNAGTTLLQYFGHPEKVKIVVFWLVGSLDKGTWHTLPLVTIVLAGCIPLVLWKSWDLNVMASGDETAKSLGVNVERVRISTMVTVSLLVAGIVCFTGTIGFIGLVAPHICRIVIGGDNRFLLPASGVVGAAILVVADTVARTVMAPIILPVGVMTAFMGAPLFLYLIMSRRKEYW